MFPIRIHCEFLKDPLETSNQEPKGAMEAEEDHHEF